MLPYNRNIVLFNRNVKINKVILISQLCNADDIVRNLNLKFMTINSEGHDYHVTGQGQGNFNTVGAAAGIASLLGVNFSNILGARYNPAMSADALLAALSSSRNGSNDVLISSLISMVTSLITNRMAPAQQTCSENTYVNRYELNQTRETDSLRSENALLKSQVYTDQKLSDIVKDYNTRFNAVEAEIRANKDEQNAINMEQAKLNATQTAAISCIRQQVAELNGEFGNLTKNYVPSYNVCQQSQCGCNNGYGASCCSAQVIG